MIDREDLGAATVLTVRHGRVNALDLELLDALAQTLAEVERDRSQTSVVLTGSRRIFSAGVDLFRVVKGGEHYLDSFLPALTACVLKLFTFPRPVVAAINGHAVAGGCVLACACDYRIMVEGKGTIGLPELRVGVPFPSVALEIMRFAVPAAHRQKVIYLGRTYRPRRARRMGLVDETVKRKELLERACEVADSLGAIPSASFQITKRQLRKPVLERIERQVHDTEPDVVLAWKSPEAATAIRDYLEATLGRSS